MMTINDFIYVLHLFFVIKQSINLLDKSSHPGSYIIFLNEN